MSELHIVPSDPVTPTLATVVSECSANIWPETDKLTAPDIGRFLPFGKLCNEGKSTLNRLEMLPETDLPVVARTTATSNVPWETLHQSDEAEIHKTASAPVPPILDPQV